jgi:ADP-ribose pyrophosphatase YjhB (NUDIX family)
MPQGDNLERFICTNCAAVHYINPKMVVGCLPIFGQQVLLAKRAIEPRKNLWNVPCGFMECDETVQQGAIREVFEETGALVHIRNLHCIYDLPHAQQVYLIFLADLIAPDFQISTSESTEVRLFNRAEIPWTEMAFTSSTFALQRYFEDLDAGITQLHFGKFDKRI